MAKQILFGSVSFGGLDIPLHRSPWEIEADAIFKALDPPGAKALGHEEFKRHWRPEMAWPSHG